MRKGQTGIAIFITIIAILTVAALFYIGPLYNVWAQEMSGKAQLREAEWNKQIAVEEALATKEAATLLAEAEVERAKGVAEANKIIAKSIDENYLKYLYIQGLQTNQMQTIYIPTNGLLPVFDMNSVTG
jgi:hypothetical protein